MLQPAGPGSWLRNTVLWLEQLEASSPHIDAPAGCTRSMIAMHFVNFQLDQPGYIKLQVGGHIYTPSVSSLARVI